MAKPLLKKSGKYDVIIKAKATATRIFDRTTDETVKVESNHNGRVTGKHYWGVHWDNL